MILTLLLLPRGLPFAFALIPKLLLLGFGLPVFIPYPLLRSGLCVCIAVGCLDGSSFHHTLLIVVFILRLSLIVHRFDRDRSVLVLVHELVVFRQSLDYRFCSILKTFELAVLSFFTRLRLYITTVRQVALLLLQLRIDFCDMSL